MFTINVMIPCKAQGILIFDQFLRGKFIWVADFLGEWVREGRVSKWKDLPFSTRAILSCNNFSGNEEGERLSGDNYSSIFGAIDFPDILCDSNYSFGEFTEKERGLALVPLTNLSSFFNLFSLLYPIYHSENRGLDEGEL